MLKRGFIFHFLWGWSKPDWVQGKQEMSKYVHLICYVACCKDMFHTQPVFDQWSWYHSYLIVDNDYVTYSSFLVSQTTGDYMDTIYLSMFGVRFLPHDAAGGGQLHLKYDILDNSIFYRKYEKAIFMEDQIEVY